MKKVAQRSLWLLVFALAASACGGSNLRRFAARPVVWDDAADRRPFRPAPEETHVTNSWPAMDSLIFRPLSQVWLFEPGTRSLNVNAVDEVPDSSWYQNRISRRPMSPEEVARGACPELDLPVRAPWRIVDGKIDGATLGFQIEDADGNRYVLKIDRAQQPEQATAADAVVSSIFHAAGYHVPCNRVVFFERDELVISADATLSHAGGEEPLTSDHVERVLDAAQRTADGRYRATVSLYIDGRPIGPWDYRGTRDDDPNDVIPHERRRELRGMYVLAAWVGRWDARPHNTLSAWVDRGPQGGYVRHYVIDFGECLGLVEGNHRRARRFGHSQWLDTQHVVEDALTFGVVRRPWDDAPEGPEVLGNFDVEHFDADQFRPDYWNGAFDARSEADSAWMARIIARFDRPHLEAVVQLGRYSDPEVQRTLVDVLMGRRERILERYLTRLSPLSDPRLRTTAGGAEACFTDLAVASGIRDAADRSHLARIYAGDPLAPVSSPDVRTGAGGEICVPVPARSAESAEEGYVVVDVHASTPGRDQPAPLRLHLVMNGANAQIVGLERPEGHSPPS
ncbi:MAG: hypothetical protein VYE22_00980 [Myxococcota bacterium]|nr:hypothetical protein [Myxococcota bacterium]